jgi:hypothetical protein
MLPVESLAHSIAAKIDEAGVLLSCIAVQLVVAPLFAT